MPFLKRLKIEAFRGFSDPCEIDLDASAVVVSGANGRGKTSLTDAIQWLLIGRLPRLARLRNRMNEEYIVNQYAQGKQKLAIVEATLSLASGNEVLVRREGNHVKTLLTVIENDTTIIGDRAQNRIVEAVCGSKINLDEFEKYILSTAILQQDTVRAFLWEAKAGERYELLVRLMGVEVVQEFVEKMAASVVVVRDREHSLRSNLEKLKSSLTALEDQKSDLEERARLYSEVPSVDSVLQEIATGSSSIARWAAVTLTGSQGSASRIAADLRQMDAECRLLRDWIHDESAVQQLMGSNTVSEFEGVLRVAEAEAANAVAQVDRLDERVAGAENAHDTARRRAAAFAQLANAALDLLGPSCPVCQQHIDVDSVAARLRTLVNQDDEIEVTRATLESARNDLSVARDVLRQTGIVVRRFQQQLQNAQRVAREAEERSAQREASVERLARLVVTVPASIRAWPKAQATTSPDRESALAWLEETEAAVARMLASVEESAAAASLNQVQVTLRSVDQQIDLMRQQIDVVEADVENATKDLDQQRLLATQSKDAASEVVDAMFDELRPVVHDLFSRLAPHPTFTELSLINEVYRGKGSSIPTAKDPQSDVDINPSTTFSSAQLNVVAICFFLAFAFSGTNIRFPFVILDDPLQSMDDINVLGFSDLCRFLKNHKQLIITTHERRLASLLVRKLTPRDGHHEGRSIEFTSWDRHGPRIETRRLEPEFAAEVFSAS